MELCTDIIKVSAPTAESNTFSLSSAAHSSVSYADLLACAAFHDVDCLYPTGGTSELQKQL